MQNFHSAPYPIKMPYPLRSQAGISVGNGLLIDQLLSTEDTPRSTLYRTQILQIDIRQFQLFRRSITEESGLHISLPYIQPVIPEGSKPTIMKLDDYIRNPKRKFVGGKRKIKSKPRRKTRRTTRRMSRRTSKD